MAVKAVKAVKIETRVTRLEKAVRLLAEPGPAERILPVLEGKEADPETDTA